MSQPPFSGPPPGEQPPAGQSYPGGPDEHGPQPYPGQPYPGQPYPGQPYPGQPNPDVPSSLPAAYPPQYGEPEYGLLGFGQDGYGAQPEYGQPPVYGQPGFPPPLPEKKSKVLPVILTVVGLVLVLCLGASVTFYLVAKRATDKSSPTGAVDQPGPVPAVPTATSSVKLVEPETLGGRPKLTDPQYARVGEILEQQFREAPGATSSIGALYGTVAEQNVVMVAGSELAVSDPAASVDGNMAGTGFGGVQITDISDVSTGAFGGAAKCGSAQAGGLPMTVCSWADEGSSGVIIWYLNPVAQAKVEFPGLRAQIETKG
jgi:hypothetical protein